jgi:hypothetical protein
MVGTRNIIDCQLSSDQFKPVIIRMVGLVLFLVEPVGSKNQQKSAFYSADVTGQGGK